MARKTAAERKEEQRVELEKQEQAMLAYKSTLPFNLLTMMARIGNRSDVSYTVEASQTGAITVEFTFACAHYPDIFCISLTSFEWEVEEVERRITELEDADREKLRMRQIAKDAYELLTEEQRVALGVAKPY